MLYKVGTRRELTNCPCKLPFRVFTELFKGLVLLDVEYGEDRDYFESGGYSIIVEDSEDLPELYSILDINIHMCEWATTISNSGYVSALYIINDDFSIMVYMPKAIVPSIILADLED